MGISINTWSSMDKISYLLWTGIVQRTFQVKIQPSTLEAVREKRYQRDQGSRIWIWFHKLNDILVLSMFTQHTSSSCLNEIEIENESKSFLYRISCSSKPGRREIPIHLNTVTSQLIIKLKFSGYIYLSEVSWTSGPIENTTHEILYPSQQSILVVSISRSNVWRPINLFRLFWQQFYCWWPSLSQQFFYMHTERSKMLKMLFFITKKMKSSRHQVVTWVHTVPVAVILMLILAEGNLYMPN